MKILITGAHFTPAQAVIEELKNLQADIEIIYIGRNNTLEGDSAPSAESKILPTLGVKFYPLIAGRLRRSLDLFTLISFFKIPIGFIQALYLVSKIGPNVVLSFGGYVGLPVVIAAWLLSIPIILHEQTLVSGLANKISSFFANKVAVSFDSDYSFKNIRTVLTGNPLRKDLLNKVNLVEDEDIKKVISYGAKNHLPLILVTGGNQGSHIINITIEDALPELLKKCCVIHQTGDSKFQDFERLVKYQSEKYVVKKWISSSDMAAVFSESDLAVSRAGANTLTELAYFEIPTVVVPIPNLNGNEQVKNAKYFQKLGLVEILEQDKLNKDNLLKLIKFVLSKNRKSIHTRQIVIQDAAKRLTQETLTLTGDV